MLNQYITIKTNKMENLNYKRISLVLLILVILLIIPHFCNNTDRLQGQYDILKKQLSEQKELINKVEQKRIKEKDSLMFQISQREVFNSFLTAENGGLKQENKDLKNKLKYVSNRTSKKIKGLENLVTYYNSRFKVTDNKVIEDRVGLTEETASDISWELEEYDKISEMVVIQDSIIKNSESVIKNQDTIISNLNEDKADLSLVISSAENEITERKKLQEIAEENIEVLEKQVKKQKRKTLWNKILIGVGTVGGFLLGTQISK
jgi:cell division protein FtsB